jgi:hypothetical protein
MSNETLRSLSKAAVALASKNMKGQTGAEKKAWCVEQLLKVEGH